MQTQNQKRATIEVFPDGSYKVIEEDNPKNMLARIDDKGVIEYFKPKQQNIYRQRTGRMPTNSWGN